VDRRVLTSVSWRLFLLLLPTSSAALQAGSNDLYVRVVDVGPGLCVVTKAPPGKSFVYDAGHGEAGQIGS
jgi:beta-lactamase superfamily II metal-dependent hydrolase